MGRDFAFAWQKNADNCLLGKEQIIKPRDIRKH